MFYRINMKSPLTLENIMKKTCSVCGKEFETKNCQKYCCRECYRIAFNKEQRDKRKNKKEEPKTYIKVCPICGKEFKTRWIRKVYCSSGCVHEAKKAVNKKCYYNNQERYIAKAKNYRDENKEEIKKRKKEYRKKNKEKISEHGKKYYKENREEKKAKRREYVDKNREEVNRKQRERYHDNIEENRKRSKENYQKHKDKYKQYNDTHKEQRNFRRRHKRKADATYKMKDWCRGVVRRCISSKSEKTFNILNYTPQQLREHLEAQFPPEFTWDNYGTVWHIDHIKPLDAFNFYNEDGSVNYDVVREANALMNLRPMKAEDNLQKSATWTSEDEEEYQRRKRLDNDKKL